MPRIDPLQLLRCLSVLLSPKGAIKSEDEVQRLASLMTKFSKKLVSKCIYVSILKASPTDLLVKFMSVGGWNLTFNWLNDSVQAKNWPLVTELVDLLLICPVDIDRLRTNACPKLIKTLSKDMNADIRPRLLASRLVDQWLKVVRGDDIPVSAYKPLEPRKTVEEVVDISTPSDSEAKNDVEVKDSPPKNYKITIRDGSKVLAEINKDHTSSFDGVESSAKTDTVEDEECEERANEKINDEEVDDNDAEEDEEEEDIRPVKLRNKKPQTGKMKKQISPRKPAKVSGANKNDRESTDSASSSGKSPKRPKETVKDSKKLKIDNEKPNNKGKLNSTNQKQKESNKSAPSTLRKEKDERDSSKPKERLSLSLKSRTTAQKDKDKTEKTKVVSDDNTLTDKEKESLSKFITPPISKLGKIPKKTSSTKEDKQSEEKTRALKEDTNENKIESKKSYEIKKPPEVKRPEKKYSISVEPKRTAPNETRPKTVKTFNSKFRSTGLEEEVKPPHPKTVSKKPPPSTPPVPSSSLQDKKLVKRTSPPPENHIPEKKAKQDALFEEKKPVEKAGGIKLIPPKPKPMFLQESDVFMDAMLAANMKKPKQRKRKGSISKDSPTDAKKDTGSPNTSPRNEDVSPSSIKPTFKFYQDTLESSMEEDKDESSKNETDSMEFAEPSEGMASSPVQERVSFNQGNESLKGVLVYVKSKKQKKSVTWKEDNLEAVQYFELDETERVNVTKNFADMKTMEREMESQNINILARKLAVDDVMEERTRWRALIPIDTAPVTAPGKNSQEKEIQYAREKTVVAAIYYTKRSIPDSPSEPDLEIHATTDPVSIPLEDVTGTTEVNDFTKTPWPEPRGQPPPPSGPPPPAGPPLPVPPPQFVMGPGGPGPGYGPSGPPFPPMGPFMPAPGMPPMPGPGDVWRTADGKVVPITPDMFPPGMMAPGMGPPMGPPGPMMLPPGVTPEMAFHQMGMGPVPVAGPGPNPSPEGMPQFGGFGPMGPAPPGMGPPMGSFGPPPPGAQVPPQGPVPQGGWQGTGPGAGGSWYHDEDKGPGEGSRRGGYQGGNWRGGGGRGRDSRDPDNHWNPSNPRIMPVCNNFKRGSCKMGSRCRFRHPARSDH